MKKTTKFLTVAALLATGFSGTAMADEGFSIGADVVSSYVWRGTELGDSFAIQPSLSYTFPGMGVEIGAWGSYAIEKNTASAIEGNGDYRYKEIDLYLTVPVGPASVTLTSYSLPNDTETDSFDFSSDGINTLEVSASAEFGDLSLLAAVFVGGNDYGNATYCEAGYQFYEKDGYTASAVVGAGDEDYYGDLEGKKFAVVNTGVSVSKDRYTASYIYNPDTAKSNLVFMASF
ncbi:hypothetical protein EKD02_01345 [Chlorobium phaeovibrioides]|uniref:Porin n=1 Tax=Chlorobium phaeovibrioides TaxID=1094 RepID=A0A3S0LRK0_CHLPH|nr:hypothetical protein [Chlorobium phaeovibrioides]MWV54062.1 hypothetical protein [Chlorobium phaeovibrioides]RTY40070.1 hypothetical protein EKD02_01345 [Chlorobium phaeovibrioides]